MDREQTIFLHGVLHGVLRRDNLAGAKNELEDVLTVASNTLRAGEEPVEAPIVGTEAHLQCQQGEVESPICSEKSDSSQDLRDKTGKDER